MKKHLTFLFIIILLNNTIAQTGNVGIGTPTPANNLTINGNQSVGAGYTGLAAPTNGAIIQGNVGIGTPTPTTKLDINGQIKITDGTQGDGKILTSDAAGLATWQPAPGSVVITGNNNQSPNFVFVTPPTTEFIADCPITLNKGIYNLFYYVQFDYYQTGSTTAARALDPTNSTTLGATFPRWIYFNFVTSSGSADFPSYPNGGTNNGPHVIPIITYYQVASKINQLVVVHQDNTVIRPRYWQIGAHGRISNIGPIIAVKM